ncbi:MAG: hypothetical protein AAGB31_05705 [Bdellovibrio sp.]
MSIGFVLVGIALFAAWDGNMSPRKVGGQGLDSVVAMAGHKDLKLADHYSKIDGEVQKETSLKIFDHIREWGLNEVRQTEQSNVTVLRRLK